MERTRSRVSISCHQYVDLKSEDMLLSCVSSSCNGKSFGVRPVELWSRRVQHAEGPKAFDHGYRKMIQEFSEDPDKTDFIYEL